MGSSSVCDDTLVRLFGSVIYPSFCDFVLYVVTGVGCAVLSRLFVPEKSYVISLLCCISTLPSEVFVPAPS